MSDPKQALQQTGDGAPPAPAQVSVEGVEDALLDGDLSKLTSQQRLDYYEKVCESVGLNPLTKPFEYIRLNGQLTLYATRAAAEQLRKVNGISITDLEETWRDSLCIFRAKAEDAEGRTDVATGAVDTSRSSGQDLANDIMKAETKAKRRVTLSLAGLGWLDETEVSDIPDQATEEVNVDYDTGEVKTQKPNKWYKQATDWLIDTVQDGEAEASDVLANADSVPSEHPIDDWPDEYAEAAIEHIKNAATLSGKAEGASSKKHSERPTKGSPQKTSQTTSPQKGEEDSERQWASAEEAINKHFDIALQYAGVEPHKYDPISEKQLKRLYAIADDEDWSDSHVDRMMKDLIGYQSKSDIPAGEAYEEVIEALQSPEMRFWMGRDPDTPDMFGDTTQDPDEVKEAADAVEVEGEDANEEEFEDGDGLPF